MKLRMFAYGTSALTGRQVLLPRRNERLTCSCGKLAKVHDTGAKFFVKCPSCNRKTRKHDTEKVALDEWSPIQHATHSR